MHFDFISEQDSRKKKRDQATKHLIRKRATQAAALTKRKEGTIRDTNPLQLPPWALNERAWESADEIQSLCIAPGDYLPPPALTIINNVQINAYYQMKDQAGLQLTTTKPISNHLHRDNPVLTLGSCYPGAPYWYPASLDSLSRRIIYASANF